MERKVLATMIVTDPGCRFTDAPYSEIPAEYTAHEAAVVLIEIMELIPEEVMRDARRQVGESIGLSIEETDALTDRELVKRLMDAGVTDLQQAVILTRVDLTSERITWVPRPGGFLWLALLNAPGGTSVKVITEPMLPDPDAVSIPDTVDEINWGT